MTNEEERIIRSIKYIINQNYVDIEDDIIGILIKALNLIEKQENQIKAIYEEFNKYDWENSNERQLKNQIKSLYGVVKGVFYE